MEWRIDTGDPILDELGAYWSRLAVGRELPDWADVDPIRVPRACLRFVVVADLADGGASARYRLVGTNMVDRFGMNFTGKTTAEIMSDGYHRFITGLFQAMCRHRAPVYSCSGFRWDAGRHLRTSRLFMPMTNGGDDVAIAFVGQTFADDEPPLEPLVAVIDQARCEPIEMRIIARA